MEIFSNWRILIILYLIVSGVWGIFAKLATNYFNPFTASFSIVTVAWMTVAVFSLPKLAWSWNTGAWMVLLAGICGGISSILFYGALKLAPATLIVPLSSLSLVVTIVLSIVFLGESLSVKQFLGIALGLVAIVLLTT